MIKTTLTAERLRELLDYDPATGVFRWKVRKCHRRHIGDIAGFVTPLGYRVIVIDYKKHLAHRLAWLYVHGVWPAGLLDHRHGVEKGDGINNLREASFGVNAQNRRAAITRVYGGPMGTTWAMKLRKWKAQIYANGRNMHLGYFETAEEAHRVYIAAKRHLHEGNTL